MMDINKIGVRRDIEDHKNNKHSHSDSVVFITSHVSEDCSLTAHELAVQMVWWFWS